MEQKLAKPAKGILDRLKIDPKSFFTNFAKGSIHTVSLSPEAIIDVLGIFSSFKGNPLSREEKAFLLIYSSFARATYYLIHKERELLLRWASSDLSLMDEMGELEAERIASDSLEKLEVTIDEDFYRAPDRAEFVDDLIGTVKEWLKLRYQIPNLEDWGRKFSHRLKQEFVIQLHNEFYKNEKEYQELPSGGTNYFDNRYSEVKAIKKYESYLSEQINDQNDLYVYPDFLVHHKCFKKEDERLDQDSDNLDAVFIDHSSAENELEGSTDSIIECISNIVFSKSSKSTYPHLASNQHDAKLFILLGYTEQGKTTFCQKFMADVLAIEHPWDKPILYLDLSDNVTNPTKFFQDHSDLKRNIWEEAKKQSNALENKQIDQNLKQYYEAGFWILDGFEDLVKEAGADQNQVTQFMRQLARITNKRSEDLYIIVTTRPGYVDIDKLPGEGYFIFHLSPLSRVQQTEWIRKYFHFDAPFVKKMSKQLESIHNNKDNYGFIIDLLGQPQILSIILKLTRKGLINLNDEKISEVFLYQKIIDERIENERIKYPTEIPENLLKEEALADFAFKIYNNPKIPVLDIDSQKRIIGEVFFRLTRNKTNPLDEFEDGEDSIQFINIEFEHKSFAEFLVAKYLFRQIRKLPKKGKSEQLQTIFEITKSRHVSTEILGFFQQLLEDYLSRNDQLSGRTKRSLIDIRDVLLKIICSLPEVSWDNSNNEIQFHKIRQIISNTFYFLWPIINYLNLLLFVEKDRLAEYAVSKISYLLANLRLYAQERSLHETLWFNNWEIQNLELNPGAALPIHFSNTDLTGFKVLQASLIKLIARKTEFREVSLNDAFFHDFRIEQNSEFLEGNILHCLFKTGSVLNSTFSGIELQDCHIIDCTFDCEDKEFSFNHSNLSNTKFIDCKGMLKFQDCEFQEVEILTTLAASDRVNAENRVKKLKVYISRSQESIEQQSDDDEDPSAPLSLIYARLDELEIQEKINCSHSDFSGSVVNYFNFYGIDLNSANFSHVSFSGIIYRSSLELANFRYADFSESEFEGCDFNSATFFKADFSKTKFRSELSFQTNLSKSQISESNFKESDFNSATFFDSTVKLARFHEARFVKCDFSYSKIDSAIFEACLLIESSFKDAELENVAFRHARFESVDFQNAVLVNCDFSGALGLSIEILSKAKSLEGCYGFEPEVVEKLKEEYPHLEVKTSL